MNNQEAIFAEQEPEPYRPQPVNDGPRERTEYVTPYPETASWQRGAGKIYPKPPQRRGRGPYVLMAIAMLGGVFLLSLSGLHAVNREVMPPVKFTYGFNKKPLFMKRYFVSGTPTIIVEANENIHIRQGREGEVKVEIGRPGWNGRVSVGKEYGRGPWHEQHMVTQQDNVITIASGESDVEVTVPEHATLKLTTGSGNIEVSGVNGEIQAASKLGMIDVHDSELQGNSFLRTESDAVSFAGSLDKNGRYSMTTATGSVNVVLPEDVSFHLETYTTTDVSNEFGKNDVGKGPRPTLTLDSDLGSVTISKEW